MKEDNCHQMEELQQSAESQDENRREVRETWRNGLECFLSLLGMCVGMGNIWRFPYLCYKNGGGAFLIPYFIASITCGVPLYILELGLGQYYGKGFLDAWKIVPAFQGIGVCILVMTFYFNCYYIVAMVWTIFYLIMSFSSTLPWANCDNHWNTQRCFDGHNHFNNHSVYNETFAEGTANSSKTEDQQTVDSVVEFWERKVLHISGGIDEPGTLVWELVVCLLVAWTIVYFSIWKGIVWSGRIVYVTALMPYVMIMILLVHGLTLDGASDGLVYLFKPDFSKLANTQVWIDGVVQIVYSYAVTAGVLVNLSSHSPIHHNFLRDGYIVCALNSVTSLLGGIVVFTTLGFMARQQNVPIAEVAESGPGLVFIVYPKAISMFPAPHFWAVLFFVMIFIVAVDSQFINCESFLSALFDLLPKHVNRRRPRQLLTALYCLVSVVVGLSMVTQGGMYVFQLFDYYAASLIVMPCTGICELIAIGWMYGARNFADTIQAMTGKRIPYIFILCWKYITPAMLLVIMISVCLNFKHLTYNRTYRYPDGALALGMCMSLSSVLCIPGFLVYSLIRTSGSLVERFRKITRPDITRRFEDRHSSSLALECSTVQGQ